MATPKLTAEQARALLDYDPQSGLFVWRVPCGRAKAGSLAGHPTDNDRISIKINGQAHLAHRLAWLITNGSWPSRLIDHRDGVTTNNRIDNLRDVSNSVNLQNQRKATRGNRAGYLGVSLKRSTGRFGANIRSAGKQIHLGYFDTAELAHAAYVDAKRKLHEGCTL